MSPENAMDEPNSDLLPFILQNLTQKPDLCDTFENLCEELKYILSAEDLKTQYEAVQNHLETALDYGQHLGVLTLNKDMIRVPINFTDNSKAPSTIKKSAEKSPEATEKEKYLLTQPRRTHSIRPTVIAHGRRRKGSRRRRRSRRRR